MTKILNSKGFSPIAIIAVTLITLVLISSGWLVWQRSNNTKSDDPYQIQKQDSKDLSNEDKYLKQQLKKLVYNNETYGYSFSYGSDWEKEIINESSERGAPEDEVVLTSPSGSEIRIRNNLGGKGGGSCEENENTIPHNTHSCETLEVYSYELLNLPRDQDGAYYLAQVRHTWPQKPSTYRYKVLHEQAAPPLTARIGDFWTTNFLRNPNATGSNIDISIEGSNQSSTEYFNSTQGKEVAEFFRSTQFH